MKTRTIFFLTALLFVVSTINGQTYHYNNTKTFHQDGYLYQCDKDPGTGLITLYNKDNKYTYEPLQFKDGTDAQGAILFSGMRPLEKDDWTRRACSIIADKFFSDEERKRVKGKVYGVEMRIDSSTGKVIEVYFNFLYDDPFATIPVSTYRMIELELKDKIWFTPTADGRRMKFIMRGWNQKVSPFAPLPDVNPR